MDIIARSAKIVGDLTAKSEVNIITGDVNYDYNTDGISKNDNADVNAKPEIAIDAAVFGSITAGRIRIIANEDGVGVKSHSTLTSNAEDIIIKANGEIEVRNVKAANDVKITSNKAANIKVVGNDGDKNVKIRADRDVVLTSNGDIVNEGIIEADYDVKLSADNNITNNNIIRANHNVELTKALNLVNNKDVEANNDLIVKNVLGGVSINGGSFVANNDINISDSGYLVLTNSLIQAKNNASILLNESLTNGEGSRIHADNYLHITSSTFNNAGLIDAGNNVRIKTTNASTLIANQIADFNHQIHHIDLQIQKLNADLVPDNNPNRKWFTVSEQTQNLINQLQIKRSELIQKRNAFGSASNIAATDIINSGLIYSGNELSLYSANNIANYNTIFANSNIYLGDEKIDQKFLTDINLNADVSNIADLNLAYSFTNYSAKVETSGDLNVHLSGGFNNRRTSMKNQIGVYNPIPSKPSIDININGYASTTSEVIANNINVISDSFLNDSSSIIAAGNIDIKTNSFLNLAYLLNGGRIGVTYERDNINGDYYDHRNINDPYYSTIKANGDIDITVNGVKTSSNSDSNPNDIVGFINSGSIYGGQTLTINVDGNVILSGSLDNIIIKEKVIDLSSLTPKVDGVVIRINQNGVADLDDPSYGFYLVNQIYEFDPKKYTSQSRVINDIRRLMSNPNLASKVVDCIHGGQSMEACVQSVRNEDIVDNVVNEIDQKILIQTDPKTLNDTIRRAALAYSSSGSFTGANTAEEDRNNLSNNAIEFVIKNRDLGLKFGESLTEDQIAKLDKPILWYERKTIDGKTMLVAKIYTPLKDDNNNINGTISGGEVNIASTNDILISNGSLGAAGDINLNADGKVSIINDKAPEALLQASNFTASAVTDQTPKNDANTTISGITFNAGTDINISGSEVNITNDLSQAGGSIFITSTVGDINNINYQIAADQNIILNSANDINNIYADSITSMHAGNVLSLNAQNDINNRGASLNGDNLVYLVAGNNINNEALIQREVRYSNGSSTKLGLCSPLGGQGGLTSGCSSASANRTLGANNNSGDLNITSTLIARGEIKSTSGNVVLVANNDINNVASDIISDNGQIYLEATTGDVNIVTDVLRNRSVNRWKHKKRSGIKITDVTTNVASNIQSAGNINIISGGDTNIKGSNVTSTGGGLNVDATGDLNILAVEDSYYRHESSNKKGSFGRKSKSSYTRSITTQQGSNINVANNINSDIKKNINISASDLTAGGDVNLTAKENISIVSSQNLEENQRTSSRSGLTTNAESDELKRSITQIGSKIKSNSGNANIKSGYNTNIIASDVESSNNINITVGSYIDSSNNETINNDAKLNIVNAKNSEYSYLYQNKTSMDMAAIVLGGLNGPIGTYAGTQARRGNTDLVVVYDEDIVASNIKAGNNLNLRSASDSEIRSSNLDSSSGSTTIIAGSLLDKNNNLIITDGDANSNISSDVELHFRHEQHKKLRADYGAFATAVVLDNLTGGMASLALIAQPQLAQKNSTTELTENKLLQDSGSNINSGSTLVITSQNDTNISASNVKAVSDVVLQANNQVNLVSGQNLENTALSSSSKRAISSVVRKYETSDTTQVASNLNVGGNLMISSGGDTNIVASNINVGTKDDDGNLISGGTATIEAGKYTDISATEIYDENATVNIISAADLASTYENTEKMSIKFNDIDKIIESGATIYNVMGSLMASYKVEVQNNKTTQDTLTNKASNINVGNSLTINSAANTNLIASDIVSGGDVNINAGKLNVNGVDKINSDANINIRSKKDVSTYRNKNIELVMVNEAERTGDIHNGTFEYLTQRNHKTSNAAASITSGNNLNLNSQNDINVISSDLKSANDTTLTAYRKVNVMSSADENNSKSNRVFGDANLEFTANFNQLSVGAVSNIDYRDIDTNSKTQVSSNIMSGGDLIINGNDDINLIASNLIASGDVDLTSSDGEVNVLSADNVFEESDLHLALRAEVKAGITYNFKNTFDSLKELREVSFSNLVDPDAKIDTTIELVKYMVGIKGDSIDEMLDGNEETLNDTSRILNAGRGGGTAGIVLNVQANADINHSSSQFAVGSIINSGNSININSGGDKDININGSGLMARNDINLVAGNDVNITASENTNSFKNVGGSVYMDIALYGYGYSYGGELHGHRTKNSYYVNSSLTANNNVNVTSGNDTNVIGGNILARNDLNMNVGNDLNIETLQNDSEYKSFSVGGGYGYGASGGSTSRSGHGSFSYGKGSRIWADNQTSLIGENSVTINVANNTDIKGGLIANRKVVPIVEDEKESKLLVAQDDKPKYQLVDLGNLTLNTKTLTYSDLYDKDKARNLGVSGSYSSTTGNNSDGRSSTARGNNGATSRSGSINYYSKDIKQITRATVGNGNINVGGNNNTQIAQLNRDITNSQVITKELIVDPINASMTVRSTHETDKEGNVTNEHENPFRAKGEELMNMVGNIRNLPTMVKNMKTAVKNIGSAIANAFIDKKEDKKQYAKYDDYKYGTGSLLKPFSDNTDAMWRDFVNVASDVTGLAPGDIIIPVPLWQKNTYFNISAANEKDRQAINKLMNSQEDVGIVQDGNKKFITAGKKEGLRNNGDKRDYTIAEDWNYNYSINQSDDFTVNDLAQNPNLASNRISSNGIMNNKNEAARNAIMQLGGFGENNKITISYDYTGKGQGENRGIIGGFKSLYGLIEDTLEVSVNQFGGGVLVTGGAYQDRQFLDIVMNNARANQQPINLSGHSAGGRRNYTYILNSNQNSFLDNNGNSLLNVQFYGTPANLDDINNIANYTKAGVNDFQINYGDFVGDGLGRNNGNARGLISVLFTPLLPTKKSRHSNYHCEGSHCAYNE